MRLTGNSTIDQTDSEWVIGSDEVGFGAWAGPLVVAGVAVKREWHDPQVRDSKQMSQKAREEVFHRYWETAIRHVRIYHPEEIDHLGVGSCLHYAHAEVLDALIKACPSESILVVVDGSNPPKMDVPVVALPKADSLVPAVSLASVFAKVTRDRMMEDLEKQHPGYGFAAHKGYGTKAHQAALNELGVCPAHRKSYRPIAQMLPKAGEITLSDLEAIFG